MVGAFWQMLHPKSPGNGFNGWGKKKNNQDIGRLFQGY